MSKATTHRNNLISCHKIPVQKMSVLYTFFITFYSVTTNERAKANCVCDFFPPYNYRRSTSNNSGKRKDFPNPSGGYLLLCCHGQALQSDRHVPQALLKRCHQVSLKSNHTGGVCSLPPKRSISAGISSAHPVHGIVCCVNGAEKTTLLRKGQMSRAHIMEMLANNKT